MHASVRPARIAILVEKTDTDCQHTCLRIIEIFSRLWGGAYNIIVPTDGTTIDERFWALLEAFDPDYLYRYQKSYEDLLQSNPEEYGRIVDREVDNFYPAIKNPTTAEAAKAMVQKELRKAWLSIFQIAPTLQQEVKVRLAPFWFQEYAVDAGAMHAGYAPGSRQDSVFCVSRSRQGFKSECDRSPCTILSSLCTLEKRSSPVWC